MVLRKKQLIATKQGMKKDETSDPNQEAGLSLDEYFNSKKDYTIETMKEKSELLEKKEMKLKNDNAMVMTRVEDEDTLGESGVFPICPMHTDGDTEEDPYEDDYESESGESTAQIELNGVAGLTLSDYLTGGIAPKQKEKKKPIPTKKEEIEGMSLDSYLGASLSLDDEKKKKK